MDALDDVALSEIELQPGRIKWFDKAKGFGFANVFGKSEDIFVHIAYRCLAALRTFRFGWW